MMRMRDGEASSGMSDITIDSAEAVGDHEGPTSSDLDYTALLRRTKWTNEKHCMYLKAMEASFVNKLHCSMGLCKGRAEQYALKKKPPVQLRNLRDGSWKNTSFYKYNNKSEAETKSHLAAEDPKIRRFKRAGKTQEVEAKISREIDLNPDAEIEFNMRPFNGSIGNSKKTATTQSSLCRQDSVGSNTEESGQNFDDVNEFMNSNSMRQVKQKMSETTSNTVNEQVAPIKDSPYYNSLQMP